MVKLLYIKSHNKKNEKLQNNKNKNLAGEWRQWCWEKKVQKKKKEEEEGTMTKPQNSKLKW